MMTMTAPTTLSDNLLDRLNTMRQSGRYQRRDSIEWCSIKRECEQLLRSSPADGWSALAMLHAASGDVTQMERCFQNASLLDTIPPSSPTAWPPTSIWACTAKRARC